MYVTGSKRASARDIHRQIQTPELVSMGNKRAKEKRGLAHNDKIEYSASVCSQDHCKQGHELSVHTHKKRVRREEFLS
jgi:hypothetical protein